MNKIILGGIIILLACSLVHGQLAYPYPSKQLALHVEHTDSYMSYMDVEPSAGNGKTILLFHGKNFNGYYWKDLIPVLVKKGYRVIAPDQPGWGHSGKPDLHYSFHMLAALNKCLLDSLHIDKVIIIAHSMGGMLGIRFALMYAPLCEKLVLENPIGLEDYKTFVPYQTIDELYTKEKAASYESYKKYQQSYYPQWKPAYEQYVVAQAEALSDPDFDNIARVNAATYQMIYEQPVVYELGHLAVPVLLVIGQADRTIVGKDLLTEEQKQQYGQYPQLGRKAANLIKNAQLVELKGLGHIPHVQDLDKFTAAIFTFI